MPSQKTSLLMDLDETSIIAMSEAEFALHGKTVESIKKFKNIHPNQELSNYIINSGYYFFVINPQKLKLMIETIYKNGDDIIIFTSGLWLNPILSIISELCGLAPDIHKHFIKSIFLNPQHDHQKLGCTLDGTRSMPKSYRLHGLFRSVPVLRNKHFVLLDNDSQHIESCETCLYLEGVKATTDTESMDFYDRVIELMQLARKQGAMLSPSNSVYYYPKQILKVLAQHCEEERVLTSRVGA